MTVAALILVPSPADALADADGTPSVRRIAAAAWAGGATPVVVVCPEPVGAVAAALGTAEAVLAPPLAGATRTAALLAGGLRAATDLVAATTAALVWPVGHVWADAETVTTLIEEHGLTPLAVLRPAYGGTAGWPALLPVAALRRLAASSAAGTGTSDAALEAVLAACPDAGPDPIRLVDTGDPGVTHPIAVRRAALPPFHGPPPPREDAERAPGDAGAVRPDPEQPAPPRPRGTDPLA